METLRPLQVVPQLAQVDALIRETLCSSNHTLQDMVDHLLSGSGKKIRPMLVLLSGSLFGQCESYSRNEGFIKTAASVELVHIASLVHDDIIDDAGQRRGYITLHKRWDISSAILAGDYLLAGAFKLLSGLEQNNTLLPLMARSVVRLCQGEVRQLDKACNWRITEQEYLRCNFLKTSQFLAVCCEAGGRIAEAYPWQIRALCEYGLNLGQAFQIVDDILDFSDEGEKIGKPVGADLDRGVVTLPLIYLLRKNERFRALLEALDCSRGKISSDLREQIRSAVRECGALDYAACRANKARNSALRALSALPRTPARDTMFYLAEIVTEQMENVFRSSPSMA